MKKFISNIIAIIMIITTINIPLATAESNVNYPPEGNKCGYIFSLKETPDFDITNDDILLSQLMQMYMYQKQLKL